MSGRFRKAATVAAMVTASGYLLSGPATSCTSFTGRSALIAADFCFIFDCQNGLLGGTLDPCSGIGSGNQTPEGDTAPPLFTDCPDVTAGP
ncbi:MAG: hypothetical protein HY763_06470 [Planctomycetes bacterium]|nr:hypothetical protein [Planctomycetota bacterium]